MPLTLFAICKDSLINYAIVPYCTASRNYWPVQYSFTTPRLKEVKGRSILELQVILNNIKIYCCDSVRLPHSDRHVGAMSKGIIYILFKSISDHNRYTMVHTVNLRNSQCFWHFNSHFWILWRNMLFCSHLAEIRDSLQNWRRHLSCHSSGKLWEYNGHRWLFLCHSIMHFLQVSCL